MILALHYGGTVTSSTGSDFLSILVEPALGDLDAILIAPNCPSQSGWASQTSTTMVLALLDSMNVWYEVDASRTAVTGYSLGANGTWHFAAYYPERFAVAIPVSGRPGSTMVDAYGDVPMYVIHSRDDEVISFESVEEIVLELQAEDKPVELHALEGATHYQTYAFVGPLSDSIPWIRGHWGA